VNRRKGYAVTNVGGPTEDLEQARFKLIIIIKEERWL